MNNDLISRSELLKVVPTEEILARMAIMTAPTVEVVPLEFHEKVMEKTVGELLECQSNLRPKGKWIKQENKKTEFFCSECGRMIDTKPFTRTDNFPFCHCGADMREGGAE